MRRSRRTLVALVVAAVAPLVAAGIAARERLVALLLGPDSARVPTVRSGRELARCRPIELAGGGRVRIGVSSEEARPGWPVLVFLAFEDAPHGPASVRVRRAGDAAGTFDDEILAFADTRYPGPTPTFVTRQLGADAGRLEVDVCERSRRIAGRTLPLAGHPPQPWFALRPRGGVATVAVEPVVPLVESAFSRAAVDPREPLPELPDDPHATLELRVESPGRLVVSTTGAGGITHFLARLWLNGRPVGRVERAPVTTAEEMRFVLVQELAMTVDVDLAAIGARPGDRLGIQLLGSPQGSTPVTRGGPAFLVTGLPMPAATNVVEWTIP